MNVVDEIRSMRISLEGIEKEVGKIQEELRIKHEKENKYVCKLYVKPHLTDVKRFKSIEECENYFLDSSKREDVIGGITYFKGEDKILNSIMFNNDYTFYQRGIFKEFCKAISNNYTLNNYTLNDFKELNFGNGSVKNYSELMRGLTRILVMTYSYNRDRNIYKVFEDSMEELGEYFEENEDKETLLKDWVELRNHRVKIEENKMVIKLK